MCYKVSPEEMKEILEIKELETGEVSYISCKVCVPAKVPAGRSGLEWGRLIPCWVTKVLSTGRKVKILTLRCWNCGKVVWDSRNIRKEMFYGESEEGEKTSETGSTGKV